jgi:hypothetical protein
MPCDARNAMPMCPHRHTVFVLYFTAPPYLNAPLPLSLLNIHPPYAHRPGKNRVFGKPNCATMPILKRSAGNEIK